MQLDQILDSSTARHYSLHWTVESSFTAGDPHADLYIANIGTRAYGTRAQATYYSSWYKKGRVFNRTAVVSLINLIIFDKIQNTKDELCNLNILLVFFLIIFFISTTRPNS